MASGGGSQSGWSDSEPDDVQKGQKADRAGEDMDRNDLPQTQISQIPSKGNGLGRKQSFLLKKG